MARLSESARGVVYPQLTRDQLDTIISLCLDAPSAGNQVVAPDDVQQLLGYLIGYYTRRWGLPAALRSGRTDTGST